jgi:peptidoglycan/xylan/chitin deacetylase (PgdA/CDA1 family)
VLDILQRHNSIATFFLLGYKLDESKEVVTEIISAGHEIGSHSYCHLHAWRHNPISVFMDIKDGLRAVRTVTECRLFRAPYGKSTFGTLIQVWLQGCEQSWWTIDSTDSWDRPLGVEEILNRVRTQGGGIVLLHDLDRPEMPEQEKFVLDMTRGLLDLAKNEGYRICKLGEVLGV